MEALQIIQRRAARILVIDARHRVLLMRFGDADRRNFWWATPGGGLEAGESWEQAGIRELEEELGLSATKLRHLNGWTRTWQMDTGKGLFCQEEKYFLFRAEEQEIFESGLRARQALEGILSMRWWSLEELVATDEKFYPEELGARLPSLFATL